MTGVAQFDLLESVREDAQQDVEQARVAYLQFADMARRAQDMVTASHGNVAQGTLEIQSRAMFFAEQNINFSFRFAVDLSKAKDLDDYVAIQSRYAETLMKTYAQQAQDLGRLMREASENAPPTS